MKKIAALGMIPRPQRPSHYIALYLKEHGYKITLVNPGFNEIDGETCFPSLNNIQK